MTQSRRCAAFGQRRIARENKNQAVDFPRRIASHTGGQPLRTQVGHIDAFAGAVINPAVIVALQIVAADNTQMQGHLAMGAAILQGEHPAAGAAVENDGIAGKAPAQGLAGLELVATTPRGYH